MTAAPIEKFSQMIIIRPSSEVSLKGNRTKRRFLNVLRSVLIDKFEQAGVGAVVKMRFNGLLVATENAEVGCQIIAKQFGVGTFSPVDLVVNADFEQIINEGKAHFSSVIAGKTFAVRAKRIGSHGFSTNKIQQQLGAALNEVESATVKLKNPDVTVFVETQDDDAFLFHRRIKGAGGLPAGVEGKALCLISGGFDSAVAAWRILKRGVALDYLFCNLGGGAYERLVLQITKVVHELWGGGKPARFYVVDFTDVIDELKQKVAAPYRQVILKRMMYRAANLVGLESRAEAIVTGEAIGQVSSQTLTNLRSIEEVSHFPVLRPLIGFDKQEIMDEAKRVGTASLSEKVREYCNISVGHPITSADTARVNFQEKEFDFSKLQQAVRDNRVIKLSEVGAEELRQPYLFVEEFPEKSVIIDCQPEHLYRSWHIPKAKHIEASQLMKSFSDLDKEASYVLYCTYGTKTPMVAEIMQQSGYEAYAFKGGIQQVKKALQ